jgi:ribosomal protein S6--L-glutamate ligase
VNILILSRKKSIYSTRRLKEECEALGHIPTVIDPLKCALYIGRNANCVLLGNKKIDNFDVVIPRVGQYAVSYAVSVVRQFDMADIPIINNHGPIARSKNKLGCLQLLAKNGIKVPETLISRYPRNLRKLLQLVGGAPVTMKLLKGTQGVGVILSENISSVESILDAIWSLGEDIMLQKFIKESEGSDYRIFVIDGKVVATMKRIAKEGDFRANVHRGGKSEAVELPREFEKIAINSAEIIGLQVAGVDILESKEGPLVIEVNSSPGFQGLEKATGINIARKIIEYAVQFVRQTKK